MHKSPAKQRRDDHRLELHLLRRDMWHNAHNDKDRKEVVAASDYSLHPSIPIVAGDVLVQAFKYAHPALTTPIPATPTDPHSLGSWTELIARLPKRKKDY